MHISQINLKILSFDTDYLFQFFTPLFHKGIKDIFLFKVRIEPSVNV